MIFTMGKYKGKDIEIVIKDEWYCNQIKTQPFYKEKYPNEYNAVVNYKKPFNFFECLVDNLDSECLSMVSKYLDPKWSDYTKPDETLVNKKLGAVWHREKDLTEEEYEGFTESVYSRYIPHESKRSLSPMCMSFRRTPVNFDKDRMLIAFQHKKNLYNAILLSYEKPSYKEDYFLYYYHTMCNVLQHEYFINNNGCCSGERNADYQLKFLTDIRDKDMKELGDKQLDFGKHKGTKFRDLWRIQRGWYVDYLQNKTKYETNVLEHKPELKIFIEFYDMISSKRHTANHLYD